MKLIIFLAEDDNDDSDLFHQAVEEVAKEAEIVRAKNGEVLMELLAACSNLPDVLFLDINMPRKNGYECLKEIRYSEKLKNLPVIIFSTTAHKDIIELFYAAGANQYMQKPSTYGELRFAIRKTLRNILMKRIPLPLKTKFFPSAS